MTVIRNGDIEINGGAMVMLEINMTVATGLRLMEDWKLVSEAYAELMKSVPGRPLGVETITLDRFMGRLGAKIDPEGWHPDDEEDE